ncbi:methionyl-tRNA formyltransferase [Nisaea acidiphila]|uniref:Methionyl-tRNA formyltransferase n=1 Tax=Nisaea acidiphila TaxID=1862145 RepID=A0A9J7ATQ4_9PROT|nr:methionyl-tRNA formyltransferase [Nisaea acidiphila]UUX50728.1 methionyl-tRNA formyltransferase [Nisaea acidiphila]
MRIILNGQQAFGKAALEAILEKGEDEVVAVYTAPDKEGRPVDPVKEAALEHGLEVRQPADYSDPAVIEELKSWNADLMMMAYVIIFIPEEARNVPKHGSLCFHPSLLPLHRGPSSINWPIIWGAEKTGLTIFYPDDGLDEGDICVQKEVEITPDDTLGSVYFDKIFPLGIEAVLESIDLIRAGNPPHTPQDESKATYEGWCRKADGQIDWNRSQVEVYNQIRGCNPQPGAWTTLDGKELQIFDSQPAEGAGRTGRICAITDDGFVVNAGRGGILVQRVRYDGGKKVSAKEFAAEMDLKVGSKLGT